MKSFAVLFAALAASASPAVAADPTAASLARCLDSAMHASTAGQIDCEAAAMRNYDQRMNVAYAALIRRLPSAAAERLRRSQRAWLVFRDAETATRSAIFATRQGTIFVPMEADAAVVLVGDRARLLERYAKALDIE